MGNLDWAIMEANRRAAELRRAYIIYRKKGTQEYIVRRADLDGPPIRSWVAERLVPAKA